MSSKTIKDLLQIVVRRHVHDLVTIHKYVFPIEQCQIRIWVEKEKDIIIDLIRLRNVTNNEI